MEPSESLPKLRSQRGQALVLIAAAFIGLIAFVGLAVDAGIVYTYFGHLRKGVDTAALSASNQYRRGVSNDELVRSAKEFILLNLPGISDADVIVQTCTSVPAPGWCTVDGENRKRVRVEASIRVPLAFLTIVGIHEVTIRSDAESEAASLDLVMVLDNSPSMAYDAPEGDPMREPANCNPVSQCQPFEKVKAAAIALATRLYYPYDRVGIVTYSRYGLVATDLDDCVAGDPAAQQQCVVDRINSLTVELPLTSCPFSPYFHGCTMTNISAALAQAHLLFANQGRPDALWVAVIVSDGVANAAHYFGDDFSVLQSGYPPGDATALGWYCPADHDESTEPAPFCQDGDANVRHPGSDADYYDADDAARDMADFLGGARPAGGDGASIFAVALGTSAISYVINPNIPTPDVGERLMRYFANVGWDGNKDEGEGNDPCYGVASGEDCGNYFFAETADDLTDVFLAICGRIFTRLTR